MLNSEAVIQGCYTMQCGEMEDFVKAEERGNSY